MRTNVAVARNGMEALGFLIRCGSLHRWGYPRNAPFVRYLLLTFLSQHVAMYFCPFKPAFTLVRLNQERRRVRI